jgi:hypothetical protein
MGLIPNSYTTPFPPVGVAGGSDRRALRLRANRWSSSLRLANSTAGTGSGRIKREPDPLDDPILIVFRLPAAFERPEPADREEAKSARVAIRPEAIPSMSASQGVSWRISELL